MNTKSAPTYEFIEGNELVSYTGYDTFYEIHNDVVKIRRGAIQSKELKTLFIHKNIELIETDIIDYRTCTSNPNLERFIVDESNLNYKSIDGNLYNKEVTTLIRYALGKNDEVFIMPEGVIKIEDNAFREAKNIKKIVLANSYNGDFDFIGSFDSHIEIDIKKDNPNFVVKDDCLYNKELSTFIYYNKKNKEKIFKLKEQVKIISDYAFHRLNNLACVILPESVTKVNDFVFINCSNLERIYLPDSISSIGSACFFGCDSLKMISLPSKIKKIDEFIFNYSGIISIIIPSNVEIIGYLAFNGCRVLESVYISPSVKKLDMSAFEGCEKLKYVLMFDGLSKIDDRCFNGCSSLESIRIPSTVEFIGEDAFKDCSSLKEIYIAKGKKYEYLPKNVKIIEY